MDTPVRCRSNTLISDLPSGSTAHFHGSIPSHACFCINGNWRRIDGHGSHPRFLESVGISLSLTLSVQSILNCQSANGVYARIVLEPDRSLHQLVLTSSPRIIFSTQSQPFTQLTVAQNHFVLGPCQEADALVRGGPAALSFGLLPIAHETTQQLM